MNTRSDNLLIIFMKAPRSGTVKTRMQPQLTPAQSLSLYKGMGTDLLHNLLHSGDYELEVHYYPEDGHKEMQEWLGDGVKYLPQEGSNLGEKMRKAISGGIDKGYRRTIIIGSDLPTLSKRDISFAFEQLDMVDLVLGPTVDGGYYLIGAKQD
ncbi:MAG: glycosyltransferase, partial [Calditrichaeota bacterium]